MAEYIVLMLALPAGMYAGSYAKTLIEDGNRAGAAFVIMMIAASAALPIYRLLTNS